MKIKEFTTNMSKQHNQLGDLAKGFLNNERVDFTQHHLFVLALMKSTLIKPTDISCYDDFRAHYFEQYKRTEIK